MSAKFAPYTEKLNRWRTKTSLPLPTNQQMNSSGVGRLQYLFYTVKHSDNSEQWARNSAVKHYFSSMFL